jgi:DNA (cytosine-5)-methyltransferase 1
LAIPGLRFGSGVRFELRNTSNEELEKTFWRVNFFYGNSKKIKQLTLDKQRFEGLLESLQTLEIDIEDLIQNYISLIKSVDLKGLQENWINKDRSKPGPIWLVDEIGKTANQLISRLKDKVVYQTRLSELTEMILINGNGQMDNKKLVNSAPKVLSGIILGSIFNALVTGDEVSLSIPIEA